MDAVSLGERESVQPVQQSPSTHTEMGGVFVGVGDGRHRLGLGNWRWRRIELLERAAGQARSDRRV